MSTSGSYSYESSTSVDSDLDQIDDQYELEVEVLDSPLGEPSPSQKERNRDGEDGATTNNGAVLPYDEHIAEEERVRQYEQQKESERIRFEALQERLDGKVPTS